MSQLKKISTEKGCLLITKISLWEWLILILWFPEQEAMHLGALDQHRQTLECLEWGAVQLYYLPSSTEELGYLS